MSHRSFFRLLVLTFTVMAVLSAAVNIVPVENAYYYTDEQYSKIYFTNGQTDEVIINAPGSGRFFALSPDGKTIGFKHRELPGGLEAPALYHTESREIELLHEPVHLSGQVSFSQDGKIAYTIDNDLYVKEGQNLSSYDLGVYVNLAPISPDGNMVVFNDDNDQLWILELNSGSKTKITSSDYGNVMPNWSSDSRFVSYSVLDGRVEIYDVQNNSKRSLGMAAGLKWDHEGCDFSYLKVVPDEEGMDIKTDVIVENAVSGMITESQTSNVNESEVFFMTDGSVMALADGKILSIHQNSLKKINTRNLEFPVDPKTYSYKTPAEDTYLDVPYVHQVYDTPGQRGYSSCAPTTAAMIMGYYGVLPKWPFLSGFGNWSDYGAYVHERYYYHDNYFDLTYRDCNSSESYCYTCYGGMGYMWTGGSPNSRMAGYYNKHGITTNQTWYTDWSTVSSEIDKEQPYSICNFLSGSGHLIVGLGRASNGQRTVIANDPYGDRNQSTWPNYNGAVVRYDWPGYNHGHASLNYANSSYTTMPWCIATDYTAPTLIDSIVDDKQFNNGFYIKAEGNTVPMRYYRSTKSGYGGHHWWTLTEETEEDICYVTWTPQVEDGYYELYADIPANATATNALYRIKHAAGEAKVTIDQSAYSDSLAFLGKYMMVNDGSNYIYLGDSTGVSGEKIAFDAMIWQRAEQEELDFISDHQNGCPDYPVNFHVISSLPEGNYTYSWDFGDGQTGMGDTVAHAYADTGTYSITLTAESQGITIDTTRSDYIRMHQNTPPGIELELIYPDSMSIINTRTPVLTWNADSGSVYQVLLDKTPELDIESSLGLMQESYYRITEELEENKIYYWFVGVSGGAHSRIWPFIVNAHNSLPLAFDLITPAPDFVSDTLRPSFSWEPSRDKDPGDSISYKLYIGTHEDSMLCYYEGAETEYQLTENLVENETYLWYVDAVDLSHASTRSTDLYREIGINTVNEAPPAPVQIAPNHNSYQTTRYPHLEWTAVQDPDPGDEVRYEVFYWYTGNDKVYKINTTQTFHNERRFNDLKEYFWTVAAVDLSGEYAYSDTQTIYFDTQLDIVDIPEEFCLYGNYPNPFNPTTTISIGLPVSEEVLLTVYDINGRLIKTLAQGQFSAGNHHFEFNASDIPSGIYVYKFKAGDFSSSSKMLLLK